MPDDEGLREELAAALDDTATGLWMGQHGPGWGDTIARILLPVVERHAARRAAEALRAEARVLAAIPRYPLAVAEYLRDRADALAADGTEPHPAHRHDETGAGRG